MSSVCSSLSWIHLSLLQRLIFSISNSFILVSKSVLFGFVSWSETPKFWVLISFSSSAILFSAFSLALSNSLTFGGHVWETGKLSSSGSSSPEKSAPSVVSESFSLLSSSSSLSSSSFYIGWGRVGQGKKRKAGEKIEISQNRLKKLDLMRN